MALHQHAYVTINGLHIDKINIIEKNQVFKYCINHLMNLLNLHQEDIHIKFMDDLYLETSTFEVIDYRGKPYAIEFS